MRVQRWSTFRVGEGLFGVGVAHVQEVLRHQEITKVPGATPFIRGLINLRGEIVPAMDLHRRLGLPSNGNDKRPMNVVLRSDAGSVSLLVDAIEEVLELDMAAFEPPPPLVEEPLRSLLTGVFKLRHGLLLILDVGRLLSLEDRPGGPDAGLPQAI